MLNRGVLVVRQYAKLARAVRVPPPPTCVEFPSTSADALAQENAQREISLRGAVIPRRWHVAHEQQKTPRVSRLCFGVDLLLLSLQSLHRVLLITPIFMRS